jgi:hypothetical protein
LLIFWVQNRERITIVDIDDFAGYSVLLAVPGPGLRFLNAGPQHDQ